MDECGDEEKGKSFTFSGTSERRVTPSTEISLFGEREILQLWLCP